MVNRILRSTRRLARSAWLRRAIGSLAVLGILLAGVLPLMNGRAWAHPGPRVFIDVAAPNGEQHPHDHNILICHTGKGHICLEQHNSSDTPPDLPALLPPDGPELDRQAQGIRLPLPRAPTLVAAAPHLPFDPRGPPVLG